VTKLTPAEYVLEYRFPYPVAQRFKRAQTARNPIERLNYCTAAGEELLRLLCGLSLAVVAYLEKGDDSEWASELRVPTLGKWLSVCRRYSRKATESRDSSAIYALMQVLADTSGSPLEPLGKLVEIRNRFAHQGDPSEGAAERMLPDLRSSLLDAAEKLGTLTQLQGVACEEVHKEPLQEGFEATVRFCNGCAPFFDYAVYRTTTPLEPGLLYMADEDIGLAYPVFPSYRIGRQSGFTTVSFYGYAGNNNGLHRWTLPGVEAGTSDSRPEALTSVITSVHSICQPIQFSLSQFASTSTQDDKQWEVPTGHVAVGPLDRGRTGETYLVEQEGSGQLRALKVLRLELCDDPRERMRFAQESDLLTELVGTGSVVRVLEHGTLGTGQPYLLTEYIKGGSFENLLIPGLPMEWDLFREVALKAIRGLDRIHRKGILHRDVKLGNLLWTGKDVKYCDFDIGRREADPRITLAGERMGTIGYIAPELPRQDASQQSDMYALGISLTYLLAGDETLDPRQTIRKASIPEQAREALLKMTELLPENRPTTCAVPFALFTETPRSFVSGTQAIAALGSSQPRKRRTWRSKLGDYFTWIPDGSFLMGATKYPDERPVHEVVFRKPFLIGTSAVTNRQFQLFCQETGYHGRHKNFLLHLRHPAFEGGWRHPDNPVVFVSFIDAREYVLWRAEYERLEFSLPTEAEWEYVARAGSRTVYPWGQVFDPARLNWGERIGRPVPCGRYEPNLWGAFDMLGNSWEWCSDFKDVLTREESAFYRMCADASDGIAVEPQNDSFNAIRSPSAPSHTRVIRGGSWASEERNLRPANRRGQYERDAIRSCGFRIVVRGVREDDFMD
jgi:formylglycine-generating enzyme required for sulfatase activity/tRNA A-37 threonylcarbamoyl transferase component Bud32